MPALATSPPRAASSKHLATWRHVLPHFKAADIERLLVGRAHTDGMVVPGVPSIGGNAAMSYPPGRGGGIVVTWEYADVIDNAFSSSFSFSSVPIGSASSDRIVEVQTGSNYGGFNL
jgi:hypothetical protein